MKITITTDDGEVTISEKITKKDLQHRQFDVISPEYMVRLEYFKNDGWKVINAVDGYGNNCRDLFRGSEVEFFN